MEHDISLPDPGIPFRRFNPEDTEPDIPLIFDPRISTSFLRRSTRKIFGDPSSEQGLWYPPAVRKFSMPVKGQYAQGFPLGAVVHATDGRSKNGDRDAENTLQGGINDGYCYFCISSTGTIYQSFLLDSWGNHCGATHHPPVGSSLNSKFVGIEVCAAGIVRKSGTVYKPEWNETFSENEVRFSEKIENVKERGHYVRFTEQQETALIALILWMHTTKPGIFKIENVVGHDEVAQPVGRKNDPGAALSLYMKAFREKLHSMLPIA